MASLRVAMKLSMAEAKVPPPKDLEPLKDPPVGKMLLLFHVVIRSC
jgi:hypothetical protein